jgi:hypothetical protein
MESEQKNNTPSINVNTGKVIFYQNIPDCSQKCHAIIKKLKTDVPSFGHNVSIGFKENKIKVAITNFKTVNQLLILEFDTSNNLNMKIVKPSNKKFVSFTDWNPNYISGTINNFMNNTVHNTIINEYTLYLLTNNYIHFDMIKKTDETINKLAELMRIYENPAVLIIGRGNVETGENGSIENYYKSAFVTEPFKMYEKTLRVVTMDNNKNMKPDIYANMNLNYSNDASDYILKNKLSVIMIYYDRSVTKFFTMSNGNENAILKIKKYERSININHGLLVIGGILLADFDYQFHHKSHKDVIKKAILDKFKNANILYEYVMDHPFSTHKYKQRYLRSNIHHCDFFLGIKEKTICPYNKLKKSCPMNGHDSNHFKDYYHREHQLYKTQVNVSNYKNNFAIGGLYKEIKKKSVKKKSVKKKSVKKKSIKKKSIKKKNNK